MLKAVCWSEKGSRSTVNEDACLAMAHQGLFALSDGVGGGPAGEFASRSIIEELRLLASSGELSQSGIQTAIENSNQKIISYSIENQLRGMACTIVVAWVRNGKLTCFHAGDSRLYRVRDDNIALLTDDHITTVTRGGNETRKIVTKALGVKKELILEVQEWDWIDSDAIMLTSDGISDALDTNHLLTIFLDKGLSMADKTRRLARDSNDRGSHDDKTVVIVF